MTDIYDQATEREEKDRDLCLKYYRKPVPHIPVRGYCLNCLDPVYNGSFCDNDCRDDWEKRNNDKLR